jgi:DNA-binding transcriptional LysR family regulator
MYYLMPRLKRFEAKHPGLSVWISTRMTGQIPDFSINDIVITRGNAERIGSRLRDTAPLFEEHLTLVTADALLQRRPVKRPQDILRHPLITSATRPGHWESWLHAAGVQDYVFEGGHRFDHLFVAMHAVREGLGSTIAPREFFAAPSQWKLRCPLPHIVVKGEWYLAHSTSRADAKHVARFVTWLKGEIGRR